MNSVNLIGRIARDIEVRYANDLAIVKNTLAVDRFNKNGKETDFINITLFGRHAENANKYLRKGSKCGITGSIKTGSYDKDGQRHYTTEVIAHELFFLESVSQASEASQASQPIGEWQPIDDNDIPF